MNNLRLKLNTFKRLGFKNIATVAAYRVARCVGYYRKRFPVGSSLEGPFLSNEAMTAGGSTTLRYFSYHDREATSPPDWFANPWNGARYDAANRHWSDIPDFMPELGDIKTVWEASRFDWLPRMAWDYLNGDAEALRRLELWLRDWALRNPVNGGINWKCGQEASLRCLNLLVAALAIEDRFEKPCSGFLQLLYIHLERIAPTLRYAIAQDNNHGMSEAAALFVVGHYLSKHGNSEQQKQGSTWASKGRYWLENRVARLIMADGSFSQHSVIYHRLMLDVLSLTESMRSRLNVSEFSETFYSRAKLAVQWLHGMTDAQSGGAPNLGANDGAHLFNLDESPYRDFRPSVQLGAAIFLKRSIWAKDVRHPLLALLGLDIAKYETLKAALSGLMAEGGYARINHDEGFALLRLPVYRFRPSHADALHLDVWHKGVTRIRDAGTYSYNADDASLKYFPGTESHSTVCFDRRDQMPRLGRFLFGAWLKPDVLDFNVEKDCVRSGYVDYTGARHVRELCREHDGWRVTDEIDGFKREAIIRWQLAPGNWVLDGLSLSCEDMTLQIESDNEVTLKLTEQLESLYYLHKDTIPVLEVNCHQSGKILTHIKLH